jgi:alcohol dehydrogenase (cytochrome c)
LYYVQTLEDCAIYSKRPVEWAALRGFMGGSTRRPLPDEPGQKVLRAFDLRTGKAVWELPQTGPANTWGGTLSTAGGVVFFGDDSGSFSAADAATGQPLWSFMSNQSWRASPITYQFDGKQYVAVAAGPNIVAFALPQ